MKVWIQITTWEETGKGMVIYGKFSSKLIFEDFWNIFLQKVTEDQLQTKGQMHGFGACFDISTIVHKIFETNPSFYVK